MLNFQTNPALDLPGRLSMFQKPDFNWHRVNRRHPCPVCSHTDWCEVSDDGLTVHCMRQPGDKEIDWRGGGWLHFLGGSYPQPAVSGQRSAVSNQPVIGQQSAVLVPPEVRAEVIEWLVGRLRLSETHRLYLASEDMEGLGWKLGYRSLPGDLEQRKELLAELESRFGRETARGLGFVYERIAKGGWRYLEFAGVLRGTEALLIPVRDETGRAVALKARSVHPENGERLYRSMSAGNTELGASVGTPIHVARPAAKLALLENWVVITEGEKKADYIAARLGVITLGVQGVSSWRSGKLLPLLRELGATTIVEAFDADRTEAKRGKENIERQARQLCEQGAAAGMQVYGARWELEQGKGLDDYLRNQLNESRWPDLYRFKPRSRTESQKPEIGSNIEEFQKRYGLTQQRATRIADQFVALDKDTVSSFLRSQSSAPAGVSTLNSQSLSLPEAREELARLFGEAFTNHLASQGAQASRILLRTTTGTGKTTAARQQIIHHLGLGRPGRILYLTDTKQAYGSLFELGEPLAAELAAGNIAIREGRTVKPGQYHCERYQECVELGENRQPASADICGSCPFGSAANWKRYAAEYGHDPNTPRPFECEKTGYLSSVKRCKEAQVVVGPKAALLTASDELSEFDFIIIDEDCTSFLLEKQELSQAQLAQWAEGRRRLEFEAMEASQQPTTASSQPKYRSEDEEPFKDAAQLATEHAPFDRLFELVSAALSDFEAAQPENKDASTPSAFSPQPSAFRARFLPVLRARAAAVEADLDELVGECMAILPSRRFRRYSWEKPYKVAGKIIAPLRFARDLIEQLAAELDTQEGGDTRLWLEELGRGPVLQVYLPRRNLLNMLTGQTTNYTNHYRKPPTVFYLDATAGPVFRLAVSGVREVEIKVPQPLYIIQTTNALYTARSLEQGHALEKIGRVIEGLAKHFDSREVAIFSRKSFNPDYAGEEDKALRVNLPGSRFGHFERHNKGSNDYARADMLAIVGHYSQPLDELQALVEAFRNRKQAAAPHEQGANWRLRPYGWQSPDGKGLARWCRANPDPDVQAAIEHSARSSLLQTIGRGRAALRDISKPLVVALFTALPIEDLPVDELTGINDLLEAGRISERQRAALDAGRETTNAARHAEAIARIEAASQALAAAGEQYVAPGRFAQIAGIARTTLRRLGYGWHNRWIRVADIREAISLDIYISFKTAPALRRLE